MANERRLPNGHLVVPGVFEGPGGIVGEGMVELAPGDPDYEVWDAWLRRRQAAGPRVFDSGGRPTS